MNKFELKFRKLLRTVFGCLSFTAVAFVFQACYGSPPAFYDVKFTGTVKAKNTNLPVKGIKIIVKNSGLSYYNQKDDYGFTDENGTFNFYTSVPYEDMYGRVEDSMVYYKKDSVYVHFLDVDGAENGWFEDKTVIIDPARKDEVKIFVELDEKQ